MKVYMKVSILLSCLIVIILYTVMKHRLNVDYVKIRNNIIMNERYIYKNINEYMDCLPISIMNSTYEDEDFIYNSVDITNNKCFMVGNNTYFIISDDILSRMDSYNSNTVNILYLLDDEIIFYNQVLIIVSLLIINIICVLL